MFVLSRIITVVLSFILWTTGTLQVNAQIEQRNYLTAEGGERLTLEILQERASHLVQNNGKDSIDLSNFIIDISNADSKFNREFYQQINYAIGRANSPINLIFNNSIIQGDFQLDHLGFSSTTVKAGLPSLLTELEKEQINKYYPIDNSTARQIPLIHIFRGELQFEGTVFTGKLIADNSLFLQQFIAPNAKFQSTVQLNQTIFGKQIDFSNSIFELDLNCSRSHFWERANFKQADYQGITNFSNSQFEAVAEFNEVLFHQLADFTRTVFMQGANFSRTRYSDRLIFAKSKFLDSLIFINSSFEKTATFRDIYINNLINLQDLHLLDRLDFSNAFFTSQAKINTSGLAFDSAEAKIIGDSGIGKYIQVNRLETNETVLRNLIRNFRSLEQISDANNLEYQREQLRAKQLNNQVTHIVWQQIFTWSWVSLVVQWISLSLLLLIGDYGTNIRLLFAIGIITISFFSYLFWLIDRYRPNISHPVIPSIVEIILMSSSYLGLTIISVGNIFMATDKPWLTLFCVAMVILPIPIIITGLIYIRGRYHQLLNISYFVEDGSFREFRLLIGRLPIMPRFPFFRDRYQPILWSKRWAWLNYYDFSLNNIFKLGFNDIRLRDRHLPGLISTLVWYQWCLGIMYIILLLWTLSRTIPGLNLLVYF